MRKRMIQMQVSRNNFPRAVRCAGTGSVMDVLATDNSNSYILQTRKFPEISHVYSKGFLESAIDSGMLVAIKE